MSSPSPLEGERIAQLAPQSGASGAWRGVYDAARAEHPSPTAASKQACKPAYPLPFQGRGSDNGASWHPTHDDESLSRPLPAQGRRLSKRWKDAAASDQFAPAIASLAGSLGTSRRVVCAWPQRAKVPFTATGWPSRKAGPRAGTEHLRCAVDDFHAGAGPGVGHFHHGSEPDRRRA